jgi:hypothetical protein
MNAALGVLFLAGALAATFLAGAAFAVVTFFAGVVFAVAMLSFLCTEVGSKPETLIWSGDLHANGENHGFQVKKLFFTCSSRCFAVSATLILPKSWQLLFPNKVKDTSP